MCSYFKDGESALCNQPIYTKNNDEVLKGDELLNTLVEIEKQGKLSELVDRINANLNFIEFSKEYKEDLI